MVMRYVTGFTNSEEEAVGLTHVVPFLVEGELISLGAVSSTIKDWACTQSSMTSSSPVRTRPHRVRQRRRFWLLLAR
ncbi:hypothetical protein ATC00_02165 [Sinorhizobium americanum]|nr:hypothetical protein ATC00_02165 [Sinorhizobium americanum]